jgi:hypothetical protein
MIHAENVVKMFRSDLENKKEQLEVLKKDTSKYIEMYKLSIIIDYLENHFTNITILEELAEQGLYIK